MRYVTLQEALHIHDVLLKAYGGAAGVRDRGLIEAALLRPQTGYYIDLMEEAAALWESLAMNHGFVDGNERVAFACMEIFLDLNGFELTAGEEETIKFIYDRLESGSFTKDNLDAWFRANTAPS
ncbi:type II toxin-antitoxin system death-on-curing family toxin [Hoeflea ulvae]|uniref:Type II toxin-antitoxin system death-on-curing family toxin n=1 Tax=Hoeflea ulvae TaxID=2983764 RepID=A0ABT3Y9I0_9HYPH|nr:type II toxin-antitoxin system death-on-curing family toxin [Hoeflea ulvae]MCY0092544.1 type II toxin-antitoxin system death-on-curing family toxin [Hoeflea ulvae]